MLGWGNKNAGTPMPTLVEKLQIDAMDPKVSISDLLRSVKLTATKLGLGVVEDWVGQELNGYESEPPSYRMVRGRPVARNPARGWLPISGNTSTLSSLPNGQPVSALEELLAQNNDGGNLHIAYSDAICAMLDEANGVNGWVYVLQVSPSELRRILDRVRTLVLDWALALEKAGVMGSEISFDAADKSRAQGAATMINIGSIGQFSGNLGQGNVSGNASTIRIDGVGPIIEQLKTHTAELVAAGADRRLVDQLAALEAAIKERQPDHAKTRGLLQDVRNSLSGAVGNLLATGAVTAITALLGGAG
jgi:AbiTii